jgi:two-component system sensor histidine kinase/response regulator
VSRPWILVIDDDTDNLDVIVETLSCEGLAARGVRSAREALRLLDQGEHPCVIICDVMMPDVTGEDLIQHLEADATLGAIPVLLITAQHPLKLRAGIDVPILYKPFDADQLLALVEKHCPPGARTAGSAPAAPGS